ncbi:ABC transporter permease [Lutibaculum baratangense]|uniref:Peptide ABC transporter, permease protein n=1 Tax=Lutibaculum baratangense AMV1 TaxID=631454 RepID=V4QYW4_9HYPH|nr:ABC transporter permease [Lutibaculum baratangense]ESR24917.1 peptide ABC transporter, permease protein [Lutibaculum baratangense AMV1]
MTKRLLDLGYGLARMSLQAIGIVVLVFFMCRIVPGDAVDRLALEGNLTAAQETRLRAEMGLDRSLPVQFADWAGSALQGDFGVSLRYHRPVSEMLANALPSTLRLAFLSFLVGLAIAVGIAVAAVMTGSRWLAGLVNLVNVWAIALPTFCVGVIAILVFSIWLGWLPVLGGLLMPVMIIGIDNAGQIGKPLFEELREAATSAHVRTARAKGLRPWRIALFHLLPTALPVALAMSGLVLAGLVAGTLTMEILFGLPGLGSLMLNAIHGRDYPVVQAAITVAAVGLVVVNALIDLVHHTIDPRLSR